MIRSIDSNITNCSTPLPYTGKNNTNKSHNQNVTFTSNTQSGMSLTDKILTNKFAQKVFKLAGLKPAIFNIIALATTSILLRPATILVVPGSNKEDRRYAAGKSVISSVIANAGKILLCLPLANSMVKLGKEATSKVAKTHFPKLESPRFNVLNYLVTNGFTVVMSVATTALMVKTVTKVMGALVPEPKRSLPKNSNNSIQKGPSFKSIDDFAKGEGGKL